MREGGREIRERMMGEGKEEKGREEGKVGWYITQGSKEVRERKKSY